MAAAVIALSISTGFTTSGAATNSLSLTTAPVVSASTMSPSKAHLLTSGGAFKRRAAESQVELGAGADSCKSARRGLRWYRGRYSTWMAKRGVRVEFRAKPSACPRYLLNLTVRKSHGARKAYERWHAQLARKLLDAQFAICFVFGAYCSEALRVFECESGLSRHAHNGQYLGIAQMGDYARSRYGHSDTFLGQARAAYRYFAASGYDWSPWSCKPQ